MLRAGGLALLLVFRLALFVAGGMAWQGLLNPDVLLPPVDRAVNLLSLLVIVWMWVFPAPNRAADAASLLLGLLLGMGYFAALRQNVERYLAGRALGPALALHLGRLLLAGLAFVLIAQAGAAALLGALAGFVLARFLALRRAKAEP